MWHLCQRIKTLRNTDLLEYELDIKYSYSSEPWATKMWNLLKRVLTLRNTDLLQHKNKMWYLFWKIGAF